MCKGPGAGGLGYQLCTQAREGDRGMSGEKVRGRQCQVTDPQPRLAGILSSELTTSSSADEICMKC